MERYSGTQAMEAMSVDPAAEWAAQGGGTGLEGELHLNFNLILSPIYWVSALNFVMLIGLRFDFVNAEHMWQLGLDGGPESYPERPDEPNCIYYLRTGFCGYGNRCRFNHPRDRSAVRALYVSAVVFNFVFLMHDWCGNWVKEWNFEGFYVDLMLAG